MVEQLQSPEYYIDRLHRIRKRAPLAELKIESKKNKHPTLDGRSWGWYEISPLGIEIGFWERGGIDDLKGVDIEDWNNRAQELTKE